MIVSRAALPGGAPFTNCRSCVISEGGLHISMLREPAGVGVADQARHGRSGAITAGRVVVARRHGQSTPYRPPAGTPLGVVLGREGFPQC